MSSKLQKQKQIFSLLNSRLINENQDFELLEQQGFSVGQKRYDVSRRLKNQVFHFHRNLIQNINAGLLTIDLDGEITFSNHNAAHLLGYRVEDLLGKNISVYFSREEEARKFLELCQGAERIDEYESHFVHREGRIFIVGVNASRLVDPANNYIGVVLLIRDLTEVQQLRKQVERMERLALLGELSAGIAHEIRNPLAGIKAASQVLEDQHHADGMEVQLIRRIVREVDKANRLLKEFFKFAKPTNPQGDYYHIRQIIDSVYLLLAPRLKKNSIRYEEVIKEDIPKVFVDGTQIEQIILNLFINALEAMPQGGVLRVEVSGPVQSAGKKTPRSRFVEVRITDTGGGIPAEDIEKIFTPFYTTKDEGVGLGLSICTRLVEKNHASMDVISQPGQGSTFFLRLPTRPRREKSTGRV